MKAIVSALMVAFLVASFTLPKPVMADDDPIRLITVKGEARDFIVPDQAKITLNIMGTSPRLAQAKTRHDEKLKKLLKIMRKHHIKDSKIRTQQASTQPIYHYDNKLKKQVSDGYQVRSTLVVTVTDTDKLGSLLERVSKASIEAKNPKRYNQFLRVHYELSDPNKARDALLAKAISNAREKAKRMARAAGASLGRVQRISENQVNGFQPRPYQRGMLHAQMAIADDKIAPAPPAGEHEIIAHVSVSFELK
jgi:uncharacterized protein YggE